MKDFIKEEYIYIIIVVAFIILFTTMYFYKNKQYKKLKVTQQNQISLDLTESLLIANAKIDLYSQIDSTGIITFDYETNEFSIDKNGLILLGADTGSLAVTHKDFEKLIHEDDAMFYDEWFDCENVRIARLSENPYIIRIKNGNTNEYGSYLFRIKPLYNEDGDISFLICAFTGVEKFKN